MYKEYFKEYLRNCLSLSESTISHYTTAVTSISLFLSEITKTKVDLFFVDSILQLNYYKNLITKNVEFSDKNSRGNRMYSSGLNKYFDFMCNTDKIQKGELFHLDIPVTFTEKSRITITKNVRDRAIVSHALQNADNLCEFDNSHITFISKTHNVNFTEGHHLIPLKFQSNFQYSLDCYANIVSLCPNCHKLLHYGRYDDTKLLLSNFFNLRIARLEKSGLFLNVNTFLSMLST